MRTFAPVSVAGDEATPLRGTDLETASRADGWVTVPPGHEGRDAGESVTVEDWDYLPWRRSSSDSTRWSPITQ
ncbi:hypothetical protein ACFQH8_17525 [Halomicroarcula sp. GCM10025710]